jgi:cytochrome P450
MLYIGGFETNLNSFTSLAYEFVNDKLMAKKVYDNIESKNTIEELFRHSSSLNFITRRVAETVQINNTIIEKNQNVILHIASANRDSNVFLDPHIINPHRENASSHLSFGGGAHYCLGAGLSRFQIKTITKEFLKNMSNNCQFIEKPKKNKNTSMNGYREMLLTHYYN